MQYLYIVIYWCIGMGIKKVKNGWVVDIQAGGRKGKRKRKTFPTKGEAMRYEAYVITKSTKEQEWNSPAPDKRSLSELANEWFEQHGQHLEDAEHRISVINRMITDMGNPKATEMTGKEYTEYRNRRIKSGIKPSTCNHERAYLNAIFSELGKLGIWHGGNPMRTVRPLKVQEKELCFLSQSQIKTLLEALTDYPDTRMIAEVCLSTGTRWSEAETLKGEQVHSGKIHLHKTKSGKNRSIPISDDLARRIKTKETGKLFGKNCYDQFRRVMRKTGIELPDGQLTHVLRHTFASHFVMNGGHILTLKSILGHSSLAMTMRYAHLDPSHLNDAVRLNPLANV